MELRIQKILEDSYVKTTKVARSFRSFNTPNSTQNLQYPPTFSPPNKNTIPPPPAPKSRKTCV